MATYRKARTKYKGLRVTATVRTIGQATQVKTFGRMTDAKKWAEDIESDIRNNRCRFSLDGSKHTVAQLIDKYIEDTFHERRSKSFPKTTLYWWKERIGHLQLGELRRSLFKEVLRTLEDNPSAKTGKPLSNRTINSYIETFSACLSYAAKELEWIDRNPCIGLKRKSVNGNARQRILSQFELSRLLCAVKESNNSYLWPAVLISLSTGGRRGEVMSLTWNDVDLTTGAINFKNTKNGHPRTVYLAPSALEALQDHSTVRRIDSDLLFPKRKFLWRGGSGNCSLPWEELTSPFRRATNAAGVIGFRWHDLRHQAASIMIANSASLEEVGKILGHRVPQMTWRYAKLLPERSKELATAVERSLVTVKAA